jgi:carboxyl-terminal processing protease
VSRRNSPYLAPLAVAAGIVLLVAGIWWGGHPDRLPAFVRDSALVKDRTDPLLAEALDQVQDDYYRKIPRSQLVDKSITGLVNGLDDRFSHYYDPAANKRMSQLAQQHFAGVGMRVLGVKRGLAVVGLFNGSPAKKGGIRVGDFIVAVNGRPLAGRSSTYATGLITGKPGTDVRLTLERAKKKRTLRLTRADIKVPLVETKLYGTGARRALWIHLDTFESPGTHAQVGAAVRRGLAQGAKGIVFDLRGNPGGLLEEAVLTASVFIPSGTIVSTRGRVRSQQVFRAEGGAISPKIPVVVLVDRGSASSAEIVAGALRDHHRATLVGTRSFGKGVFQEVRQLPNGGALAITVGQFFLPNGENLGGGGVTSGKTVNEGKGLAPQVYAKDDPKTKADEALRVALRVLDRKLGG